MDVAAFPFVAEGCRAVDLRLALGLTPYGSNSVADLGTDRSSAYSRIQHLKWVKFIVDRPLRRTFAGYLSKHLQFKE